MSTLSGSVTGGEARDTTASQPALLSNGTAAAADAVGAFAGPSNRRRRRRAQAEPERLPILQPSTAEDEQQEKRADDAPSLEGRDEDPRDPTAVGEEPFLTKPNATAVFQVRGRVSCWAENQAPRQLCVYLKKP